MNKIFDNQSKFKRLGPVSSDVNTASIESRLQERLLDLVKADLMSKWIYDAIRPTGSQRPVVVVISPPLLQDGATAQTAIEVHAVKLIQIRLGERWQLILNQS